MPTTDCIGSVLPEVGLAAERRFSIGEMDRARHLYILGATGSGKTNLILQLLAKDLLAGRSIAVLDLRGDLVDRLLSQLSTSEPSIASEKVSLLDLREAERIIGFNPLAGSGDPHSRAYFVLDALRAHSDSWGVQLEETLRNVLIALAEAQLSLLEIEPFLTNRDVRAAILDKCSDHLVLAFFERFAALSSERQTAWVLPVLNKVTPLLGIPRLRLLFGCPKTIDLKGVLDAPGSILLVSLGADRFHSAARLVGSLIMGALEAAIMSRVDIPEPKRNSVNLYVDEFETMATEAFASIVAEGRRFRLSLCLSHQNLSQIPVNLRQVIRNNVQNQIYFQTGSIDARELKHEVSISDAEDTVRSLQALPIGHAYVCRRPHEPLLVRFDEADARRAPAPIVGAFGSRIHDAMGSLPASEVQRMVRQRTDPELGVGEGVRGSQVALRHSKLPKRPGRERG